MAVSGTQPRTPTFPPPPHHHLLPPPFPQEECQSWVIGQLDRYQDLYYTRADLLTAAHINLQNEHIYLRP